MVEQNNFPGRVSSDESGGNCEHNFNPNLNFNIKLERKSKKIQFKK